MTSTEHEEMFFAVVRRLQREAAHLSTQWLEPWLSLEAAAASNLQATSSSSSGSTASSGEGDAQRYVVDDAGAATPQKAALAVVHHIATLKAAAMGSSATNDTGARDRLVFQQTVSSTVEFEKNVGHLVPLAFAPISMLLINALDDLEAREQAMRGLLELCDTTYIPELNKGKESAATRQQVSLYKKLKSELKRVFFTLSVEIVPWLREFVSWYDGQRGPVGLKKPPASAGGQSTARGGGVGGARYTSLTSTSDDDDSTMEGRQLGLERALSLVEIPVDEDALEEYERQRKEELRQVGQQVRELRELQEYANTLVSEHGTQLEHSIDQADLALNNATASRVQLSLAAKYKIAGAALTGALVGGLLGGPIGLIAGAKSATTIGLVALAGGATGSVVGSTVASTTAARSAAVDEDYENRREHEHLHSS